MNDKPQELKPVKRDAVIKELSKLRRRDGRIEAEDVVAVAKNKRSVLHTYFCWDDTEAAHQYRLVQARFLVRRVLVHMVHEPSGEMVRVRAFVHLNNETGYRPIAQVMNETALRELYRQQLRQELVQVRERYRPREAMVNEPDLFASIDEFIERAKAEQDGMSAA